MKLLKSLLLLAAFPFLSLGAEPEVKTIELIVDVKSSQTDQKEFFVSLSELATERIQIVEEHYCVAYTEIKSLLPDYGGHETVLGTAIVRLRSNCQETAKEVLTALEANPLFDIYSNSPISTFPAVSSSN